MSATEPSPSKETLPLMVLSPASCSAFTPFGKDLLGEEASPAGLSPMKKRFIVPPFSVLNAQLRDWQIRRAAWIGCGIASEKGRDENLIGGPNAKEWSGNFKTTASTTSIFDPVLCECIFHWFSFPGAQIVDPFAGGSVRGAVAGLMGRHYWGCDLREEQIAENLRQAESLKLSSVQWVCGDSIEKLEQAPEADLIFSCPPYGDLEQYSNDPRDLSNMEWHTFIAALRRIILRACKKLKQDRFAVFVVGDFRCRKGFLRNFVGETVEAFRQGGLNFYNEAILSGMVGPGCLRVSRQFSASRKFVKTHQNVLVFCKGDPAKATAAIDGRNASTLAHEPEDGHR